MAGNGRRQGRPEEHGAPASAAENIIPAGQLASHFAAVWVDGPQAEDGARQAPAEPDIGVTIRRMREERQLSLKDLAGKSGLTQSFLSQVERGLTSPSVASLRKVAQAFGVPLAALFQGPVAPENHVVRRDQRRQLVHPGRQWRDYLLTPNLTGKLQVIWSVIEPGGGSGDEPYAHDSDEECVVLLHGRLEFWVGPDHYSLDEGDSIVFESRIPHRNINPGPERAEVLWITTPPSY